MHQPIAFMSKGFSDVECNYQIHDKEMLAIMHALHQPGQLMGRPNALSQRSDHP